MWNARPLAEFIQSSWVQVDFSPLINYRKKEERRHVAKLIEDIFDEEMCGESIQKMFEEEREEGYEGWIDRFDNSKIYDEGREEKKDMKDGSTEHVEVEQMIVSSSEVGRATPPYIHEVR
jgi:hypothetical protein